MRRSAIVAVVFVLALALGACSGGGATSGGGEGERAAAEPAMVQVTLSDFAITPSPLEVPADRPLMFHVANEGQTPHTFAVTVGGTTYDSGPVDVGGLVALDVPALAAGSYQAFCSIPGHKELGMVATVVAGSSASSGSSAGATAHSTMSAEEMAAMHQAGVEAFLAGDQTSTRGGQPLDFTMDHGVKVFELWAEPVQWEISKGVFKSAMAFNGTVPGPEIRVNPGDRVRIFVQNQLDQPTAVHFHGLTVPNEDDGVPFITQPPIMPGASWVYEFTVKDPPGMYVYHSHFNSTEQVGSGLYGAFIVEPESGWKSVYGVTPDEEYSVFLGDGPLDYVLNGKSFPATQPLVAQLGDWVLIHMANDGSLLHPMHLHGFHFQVVGEDGFPLDSQNRYMADTLVVAPGSRFDILVKADQPGAWAFHCHILPHVEGPEGMFGMVTALVVQDGASAS